MKKAIIAVLALGMMCGCTPQKQENQEIVLTVNDTIGRKLLVAPMGGMQGEAVSMTSNGDCYSVSIATSDLGFYNVISIKGYTQTILPHYVPVTKAKAESRLAFGERGAVSVEGSKDNEALAAYLTAYGEISRALWAPSADLTNPAMVKSFIDRADSVLRVYRCSEPVEEYIKIWGYLSAYDGYDAACRILQVKADEMPYRRGDLLPEAYTVLDSPIAALFANTPNVVYASIPYKNSLDSALTYIAERYTDTTLVEKVNNSIAERYVARFDYRIGFDKGLESLQQATAQYGLDPQHVEAFNKRRATVPGQPFPENVVLKDRNGNVVDFASFRGKYVYIDMWASWCVPCLREVPVLQQLEKTLKNDKVVFVSISIDAKEEPWLAKLKEKNMHGHQLWNPDNTLGQALNVKGIPFFAIYDPEGKLYMHGAPRPSQGKGLVELLEGLK